MKLGLLVFQFLFGPFCSVTSVITVTAPPAAVLRR